jgi:molecular chaperone GrpE
MSDEDNKIEETVLEEIIENEEEIQEDAAPSLEQQLSEALAQIESLKDHSLRAMAEAENIRRRSEKEKNDARLYAIDKFARDLLPISDTLGRALGTITEEMRKDEGFKAFVEGIELTEKELFKAFEAHGVQKIGIQGEKFDPNHHQAVAQIPSAIQKDHIAEVFQPGFTLQGRVLRAAMVAVSAGD